jgi:hypothetical protein
MLYIYSMSQEQETPKDIRSKALNWSKLLSAATVLVAACTVVLHVIGATRHQNYLSFWGINHGLFPKTTDWTLINGYYGVFDRFVAILSATLSNLHWLAIASIILGIYVFLLLTPIGGPAKKPAWLDRLSPGWKRLLRQVALTAICVLASPFVLVLVTAFLAVPAAFGEIAGKSAAEREVAEYKKGCELARTPCVELSKDGSIIATGFVLDINPSHIAIFDEQLQRARVLPMENVAITSKKSIK